jgi:hypothetical protein
MSKERNINEGPAGSSLATEQDLALANNPVKLDETPLSDQLLNHLSNPQKRRPAQAQVIPITDEVTIEGLTWFADPPIISEHERTQLRALQARDAELESQESQFTPVRATQFFQAQRDSINQAAKEGKDVSQIRCDSREAIEADFLHKRLAIMEARRHLTQTETLPLCARISARLSAHLAESLREAEKADRMMAAGLGVAYEPSLCWKAIATCAQRYTPRTFADSMVGGPKQILGIKF